MARKTTRKAAARKTAAKKTTSRKIVARKAAPKPAQEAIGAGLVKEIRRAISNIPGFGPAIKTTR